MLHLDEGRGHEHALPDVVDGVVGHRFDQSDRLLGTGAGTSDAKSHGGAVPAKKNV